jgi:hypothetical protein
MSSRRIFGSSIWAENTDVALTDLLSVILKELESDILGYLNSINRRPTRLSIKQCLQITSEATAEIIAVLEHVRRNSYQRTEIEMPPERFDKRVANLRDGFLDRVENVFERRRRELAPGVLSKWGVPSTIVATVVALGLAEPGKRFVDDYFAKRGVQEKALRDVAASAIHLHRICKDMYNAVANRANVEKSEEAFEGCANARAQFDSVFEVNKLLAPPSKVVVLDSAHRAIGVHQDPLLDEMEVVNSENEDTQIRSDSAKKLVVVAQQHLIEIQRIVTRLHGLHR